MLVLACAFIFFQPMRQVSLPLAATGTSWIQRGVYEVEQPDNQTPFVWTKGRAALRVPNPGGAAVLALRLAGGPGRSVPVLVEAGATQASFSVGPAPRTYMLLLLPQPMLQVPVVIGSPTIQDPAGNRRLGVVLGGAALRGTGMPPRAVWLPLALAAVWGYASTRLLGWRRGTCAAVVALALVATTAQQSLAGWPDTWAQHLLIASVLIAVGVFIWHNKRWMVYHWRAWGELAWLPPMRWPAYWVFAVINLCAGVLLLCVTPPFQAPDEPEHFFRIYQITDGMLVSVRQGTSAGGHVPQQLYVMNRLFVQHNYQHQTQRIIPDIVAWLRTPLQLSPPRFVIFSNTAVYSPVAYIPQVLSVALGRLFGATPLLLMYAGRLGTVLFYTLAVATAIRMTPVLRWVFVLLALTPMAMFQMASLSADGVTNALSFLFIAAVLWAAFGPNETLHMRDVLLVAGLGVLLALAKHTFVLIVPLCLIIPVRRFGSWRRYGLACATIIGAGALAAGGWYLAVRDLRIDYVLGANQDAQTHFVLAHSVFVAGVVLQDYVQHGWPYLLEYTGVLGWLDAPLPTPFLVSYWLMLGATAWLSMDQPIALSLPRRMLVAAILFGNMALISLLLFITWVPVGQHFIQALQGRHFIPLGPLFFLLIYRYNQRLRLDLCRWGWCVTGYALLSVGVTIITLVERYYVS